MPRVDRGDAALRPNTRIGVRRLFRDRALPATVPRGWRRDPCRLVAITGMVGNGKTALLRHLQADLARENKVLVSKSLTVDQERTTVATLIDALFYDLSQESEIRIPKQGENRERKRRSLIRRRRKPVALFVDEAHNLHPKTLIGLKRLLEVIADGGGRLSVVLAGHPKLRN